MFGNRLVLIGAFTCLFAAPVRAQPEPAPVQWINDAELTAVTFVDADRGWAVGDRGVIWHTGDGGRTWKLQNSGVTCRLEAIQFLDADNGVAVGGWTQPYWHDDIGTHFFQAVTGADTFLLGRKTWQIHGGAFEPMPDGDPFGDIMNGLRKVVVSTTLPSASAWRNSSLIKDNVVESIRALKAEPGKNRDRKNVSVKLSYDEGQTWAASKSLESGPSMYSDLAVTKSGTILCFYGRGTRPGFAGEFLTLSRFNVEWLTDGKDSLPKR